MEMGRSYQLFSIYDKIGDMFLPPFTAASPSHALRMMEHTRSMMDPHDPFVTNTSDFALYQLAHIDPVTMQVAPTERPTCVYNSVGREISELIKEREQNG